MALVATTSSRSWADFTDEACTEQEIPIYDSEKKLEMDAISGRADLELDVTGESDDLHEEEALERGDQVPVTHQVIGDVPSIGSSHHKAGRCKPCAFFHTKGCQNDKACLFCHLCPPGEKQRRKRLRERMCEKLGSNMGTMQKGTPFDLVDRRFKFGHARQGSGASTCTSSTQSACSGWSKFSHSRQSSGSSVVGWGHSRQSSGSSVVMSPQEAGSVGMHQMPAHGVAGHPQMQQMMPVFQLHQPAAQPMAPTAEGYAAHFHAGNWQEDTTQDEQASKAYSTTIELAQALPADTNAAADLQTPMSPTAVAAPPSPWNGSGVVQYALIPVPVSQLQHMHNAQGSDMPYVCFSQYPQQQQQQQMPFMSPAAGQW